MCNLKLRRAAPLVLFLLGALGGRIRGEELSTKEIYRRTVRSTAWVLTNDGSGTGWLADRAGKLLVTNHHVTGKNETVLVVFPSAQDGKVVAERSFYKKNGRPIRGQVVASDPKRDLALIQLESIPEEAAALKLAAESSTPSDRVHSVGNPGTSDALWVYTTGTVRQVYRRKIKLEGQEVDARVLETQAPLNPGDSGGPVVNDSGELIGVTSAVNRAAQLMSLCIDVSEVRDFLNAAQPLQGPRSAADYLKRARQHYGKNQLDLALADYTEAIRLDPKDFVPYRNRAVVHNRKGDYQKAVADCTEALRLNPKDPYAYLWRGRSYAKLGESAKAQADLREAGRLDPSLGQN